MLFGFALRPRMDWFSPYSFADLGPDADASSGSDEDDDRFPVRFREIPDECETMDFDGDPLYQYERGSYGVTFSQQTTTGNIWLMQADRPMKPKGPSMLFIEIHTTGVRCRSLSHDNEKACWALIIEDNSYWVSVRSNNGVR